jgi:uncharacterized membrane protein YkvA (DUF1232 family)
MSKTKFQVQVEEMLLKYIIRFIRYSRFSHLPTDRREIIVGTLLYLLDENDLIPDDVPNIGYLDDLSVFLQASKYFIADGQGIPGVCSVEEVQEDLDFFARHEGMMYGVKLPAVDVIRKKGKIEVDMFELGERIKGKYSHLGTVDA